jgi:hypothetical protein
MDDARPLWGRSFFKGCARIEATVARLGVRRTRPSSAPRESLTMRPQKQIPPENLERALKALHAVADLCLANDGNGPPYTETVREEYLTVRQAAERIKYREQTVRNMMSAGVFRRGLHYYKRRGRVLFLWSRIEQWLEEDVASSGNPGAADSVIEENVTRNDGNEPFYPVHRARSRKKRQTLL